MKMEKSSRSMSTLALTFTFWRISTPLTCSTRCTRCYSFATLILGSCLGKLQNDWPQSSVKIGWGKNFGFLTFSSRTRSESPRRRLIEMFKHSNYSQRFGNSGDEREGHSHVDFTWGSNHHLVENTSNALLQNGSSQISVRQAAVPDGAGELDVQLRRDDSALGTHLADHNGTEPAPDGISSDENLRQWIDGQRWLKQFPPRRLSGQLQHFELHHHPQPANRLLPHGLLHAVDYDCSHLVGDFLAASRSNCSAHYAGLYNHADFHHLSNSSRQIPAESKLREGDGDLVHGLHGIHLQQPGGVRFRKHHLEATEKRRVEKGENWKVAQHLEIKKKLFKQVNASNILKKTLPSRPIKKMIRSKTTSPKSSRKAKANADSEDVEKNNNDNWGSRQISLSVPDTKASFSKFSRLSKFYQSTWFLFNRIP